MKMWPCMKRYVIFIALFACVILTLECFRRLDNVRFCPRPESNKTVSVQMGSHINFTEMVFENTRLKIKIETWDYNFSHSSANDLEDLVMESGGTPVRSLIVSTWRSGSSFLGDLFNAMPSNFYNYEPLMIYGELQIKERLDTINATRILRDMFKCNFMQAWNGKEEYFAYVKKINVSVNQIKLNKRLWSQCSFNEELLCYNAAFVSKLCKLFPFQSMKLVRFRLSLTKPLLDDEKLNIKVVFLVRDPRAVMNSRRHFCNIPDCKQPNLLCSDMVHDYKAAVKFTQMYPHKLMVIRYEDLISGLVPTTYRLLKFLRLGHMPSIDNFLQTHTNVNDTEPFSTFRVSKNIPFKWKKAMQFRQVEEIQEVCKEAMAKWGYRLAHNASHMASTDFNPVYPPASIRIN